MGKPTGFLDYERVESKAVEPLERIKNYKEFHKWLDRDEQAVQGSRCMNCGVPFCQAGASLGGMTAGCPLHNLIPEWNDLVSRGNFKLAYERLAKTSNFPEFTSRVCPALCEKACTCGLYGDPVTTRENEHAIIEYAFAQGLVQPQVPESRTGKTVAVIGSGPSGLAAADLLNKRGHSVTVYERDDRIGGLLMYGIPNMKLEKSLIERRVSLMKAEGVTFVTGVNVGVDIAAEELMKSYDRLVLCCGSRHARDIQAPGRDAEGIYFAVDFLSRHTKSLLDSKLKDKAFISTGNKHVIIVGGGDTGNDCVGTCLRQGCKSVLQLEMMPEPPKDRLPDNPWPEWPRIKKTDYGQEEAAAVFGHDPRLYETTVKEFVKDKKGRLKAVVVVKLKWERDEKSGRRVPVVLEGSEQTLPCDILLIAAGFLGSEAYVSDAFGVALDGRTNVRTDKAAYMTSVPRVFTAGDMHRGQSLVVWAIREGREAAQAVDRDLMGYSNLSIQ